MIKELYTTENDLIVLSVMLVFRPGMFVSRSPDYYKIIIFVRQEMYLK